MQVLCGIVARGEGAALPGSMLLLLWGRVRGVARRFAGMVARLQAGASPRRLPRAVSADADANTGADVDAGERRPARRRLQVLLVLPDGGFDQLPTSMCRRRGWLSALMPEAAMCGDELRELLSDAAFRAMADESPQIGRLLRSACWMLGVDPQPLLPPRPQPVRKARPAAVYLPEHYPPFGPPPKWARKQGRRIPDAWLKDR